MRIILQREVDKLGSPGDVVTVADGYARNFLIPQGLASPAIKGAVKHAERLKRAHGERVRKSVTEAQALAETLASKRLRIQARAGEEGRLFGSITVADVAAELTRSGVDIDRKRIHLAEPIRSIGAHEVTIRLHPEVNATVVVDVVAG